MSEQQLQKVIGPVLAEFERRGRRLRRVDDDVVHHGVSNEHVLMAAESVDSAVETLTRDEFHAVVDGAVRSPSVERRTTDQLFSTVTP